MTDIIQKIIKLNSHARAGRKLSTDYPTTQFRRTRSVVLAATSLQFPPPAVVLDFFKWNPEAPEIVFATTWSNREKKRGPDVTLPLEGALAEALLEDLLHITAASTRKAIIEERERALDEEAMARALALLEPDAQ